MQAVRCYRRLFATSKSGKSMAKKLTPEEENHLKGVSARIIADKYCEVSENDKSLYLYPSKCLFEESRFFPAVVDTICWSLFRRITSTQRLSDLTIERVGNEALMNKFGLDIANFNHRVYWMTLHSWILHQRFLIEKMTKLESDYVDQIWLLPYRWMMDKGIPRHRLHVELEHAHKYSLKFCVELDLAIADSPETLPGQIAETVWRTIYSESNIKSATDPKIINLTKYVIRNLNFVLNTVPTKNFVQGAFIWPDISRI